MKQPIILKSNNLNIGYTSKKKNQKTVHQNLSLQFKKGSLTAIIGVNGAGKSTLIKTLIQLQSPLDGTITINNQLITDYSKKDLAQLISVVLTEKIPASNLTAYELIALGRQPHTNWMDQLNAIDHHKINTAIELTGVNELIHLKHTELSDGQLQKVLIARALAQDTPILILDEPTTHLDLSHKVAVLKLLKKLSAEHGKCIIYSTHDINFAFQIADEILVLSKGNHIQGTKEDLIESGILDSLFDNQNIYFNSNKNLFEILK